MGNYWDKLGLVPCPFYDRVSWDELAEESLTHDTRHVDHTLHSVATS